MNSDFKLREYIAKVKWKKTNHSMPHEYTCSDWKPQYREEFEQFVGLIRRDGYTKVYGGRPYICYDIDGYYYWTMGDPMRETIIINRAVIR